MRVHTVNTSLISHGLFFYKEYKYTRRLLSDKRAGRVNRHKHTVIHNVSINKRWHLGSLILKASGSGALTQNMSCSAEIKASWLAQFVQNSACGLCYSQIRTMVFIQVAWSNHVG